MKEFDIDIINGEEYVVLAGRPEGNLYLDSEAFHNWCGQVTKFSNDDNHYMYTDLRFVNNSDKWEPDGDFGHYLQLCADDLRPNPIDDSCSEEIIETKYGKMLRVKKNRIGSFLIDSKMFKYYAGGIFTNLFRGGVLEVMFHFTNDPYDFTDIDGEVKFRNINEEYINDSKNEDDYELWKEEMRRSQTSTCGKQTKPQKTTIL